MEQYIMPEMILKTLGVLLVAAYPIYLIGYLLYSKFHFEPKHFKESFESFNKNRYNPMSEDFFKKIYDYMWTPAVAYISRGEIGSGNQRDGDELMENLNRSAVARLRDHMNFNRDNKHLFVIGSLGYEFKKKENFTDFTQMFLEEMSEGTRVIPINGTWVVFHKDEKGNMGISLDQSMFPN